MIEIGAQIDLSHPADRVWRAVTEPGLLARWFAEAEAVTGRPGRLLLYTAGLPGFDAAVDAEVADRREPELIALRCHEAGRHTLLTCAITRTAEGCRLSVRETLERGAWPVEQRVRREQCYQQALTGRLPAILDWLAFQQVDLRRDDLAATAVLPVTEVSGDRPAPAGRRRIALVAGLGGAVLATGLAAWALLPGEPQRGAAPDPLPLPTGASATPATSGPSRATPSARPTRTAPRSSARPGRTATAGPSRTPGPSPSAALRARYETVSTRVFGYTGEVVVDNRAGAAARGWAVVVTLPPGSSVSDVNGADWRQDGQSVVFTGPAVPPRRSQTIRFEVRDADPLSKAPAGCTVDDDPCAGL
ncbi:SRPBCC domain-containing protein [Micromonospora sp. NBC_01655]|uniref:SRPBCC domain-containing protein n=1 Tax=Micromonospora sp. NBC_01655 TaxID=2975983 RepID=UPI002256EA06|nr:SRPBCC domain-containing protein [Micromonospora sp. NBC_01655]MCX4472566.1 SRPBCC domain-containing protein [Micromonospora sp. NBC_01655]